MGSGWRTAAGAIGCATALLLSSGGGCGGDDPPGSTTSTGSAGAAAHGGGVHCEFDGCVCDRCPNSAGCSAVDEGRVCGSNCCFPNEGWEVCVRSGGPMHCAALPADCAGDRSCECILQALPDVTECVWVLHP